MATLTTDYRAVLDFIDQAKLNECVVDRPAIPEPLAADHNLLSVIPYLGLGLSVSNTTSAFPYEGKACAIAPSPYEGEGRGEVGMLQANQSAAAVAVQPSIQAFATGWTQLEGVMLIEPEHEFDADLRVALAANNERALYDLLLSFPPGKTGFIYLAAEWMLKTLDALLEGQVMPSREGYYATASTLLPQRRFPARRLGRDDYPLVQRQWSREVWQELLDEGYSIHACHDGPELNTLLFHWQISHWRNEAHGLQAVKDYSPPYAESAITSATQEIIDMDRVATCTANLSCDESYLRAFRNVGYKPFYRVHSYLGIKRGSGVFKQRSIPAFYYASRQIRNDQASAETGKGGQIGKSKDPILAQFIDLGRAAARRERSQFVVEGQTLVQRALSDGLVVETILYTRELVRDPEGVMLLNLAHMTGTAHYLITDGLMARVTTTRPVPAVIAAVYAPVRSAVEFQTTPATTLLVAENIANPDNLGMILRTADAAGVEGVIIAGERSDPFHKNCVRAARGAVGRIPLLTCRNLPQYLRDLHSAAFQIIGAALHAESELFRCALKPPITLIVGNEQAGISSELLKVCTRRVQIPMAPGQDSLNVGVAAGVILYEILRQRS